MALAPGTRLGPYEIAGPLGAGGMGEVYQARDTRLDRAVAIKVLPAELSSDPGRRARFEREARTIAALNRPPRPQAEQRDADDGQRGALRRHVGQVPPCSPGRPTATSSGSSKKAHSERSP